MTRILIAAVLAVCLMLGGCPPPVEPTEDQSAAQNPSGDAAAAQAEPSSDASEDTCPTPQDTFKTMVPATYAVVVRFRTGPLETNSVDWTIGTAFAIGKHGLATNAHVVQAILDSPLPVQRVVVTQAGTRFVAEIVAGAVHPNYDGDPLGSPDVGTLRTADELPAYLGLPPADEDLDLAPGDELYLCGFPGDVGERLPIEPGATVPQATSLVGNLTALRSFRTTAVVTPKNTDVIQHQIPTSPGTSGAPLLRCGQLVGVHNAGTQQIIVSVASEGTLAPVVIPTASNNFAIHVKHVRDLLAAVKDESAPLEPIPPPKPATLCDTSYYNADWRVGFEPPAGFVSDPGECEAEVCLASWCDVSGTIVTLWARAAGVSGLRAEVDAWIAQNAQAGFQLFGEVNTSLSDGRPAIALYWLAPLPPGSFPALRLEVLELWTSGTQGTILLTWIYPNAMRTVYYDALDFSVRSLCVE